MYKDYPTHYYHLLEQIQKIDYALEDLLNLLEKEDHHSTLKLQITEYYNEKIRLIKIYEWHYDSYR